MVVGTLHRYQSPVSNKSRVCGLFLFGDSPLLCGSLCYTNKKVLPKYTVQEFGTLEVTDGVSSQWPDPHDTEVPAGAGGRKCSGGRRGIFVLDLGLCRITRGRRLNRKGRKEGWRKKKTREISRKEGGSFYITPDCYPVCTTTHGLYTGISSVYPQIEHLKYKIVRPEVLVSG